MPVREIRVSFWRRDSFWALLLIAFVFIAYAQVFRAGFIWDDESHLTQNPCVVGPLGLTEIWTTTQAVYYPLVLTTFWALHKFFGLNPLPYHLLNIFFSCCLGNTALAHPVRTSGPRRMARRCTLGSASGNGAIGRLGYGVKEHAVLLTLSALDFFLFELEGSGRRGF